jgi:hypothetical protein
MRVYTFTMAGDMSAASGAMSAGRLALMSGSNGLQDTKDSLGVEVKPRANDNFFACIGRAVSRRCAADHPVAHTTIKEESHDPRL